MNSALIEFTRRLFRSGGISANKVFLLIIYYVQMMLSLPFELIRIGYYDHRISKSPGPNDPLFILGHYRSGTSLLQKLLASDSRFGYLSYYHALFPNASVLLGTRFQYFCQWIIDTIKVANPFFNHQRLHLTDPDEEDDFLMNRVSPYSAYWGFVFPKRWKEWLNGDTQLSNEKFRKCWKEEYNNILKHIKRENNGLGPLLKNPPNTEKVEILLEMFPQAKFIYIFRNPFELYYSVKKMWKQVILKYYSLQRISDTELDEIIFGHYNHLVGQYESVKRLIPKGQLVEISYENLIADPITCMQEIYTKLELPDFTVAQARINNQLDKEKMYQTSSYRFRADDLDRIKARWGKFIDLYGYKAPAQN